MYSKLAIRATLFCLFLYIIAVLANPIPEQVDEPTGVTDPETVDDSVDDVTDELEDRSVGLVKRSTGKMTWFYPGLGNCGKHDDSNDLIVALSTKAYAKGKYCNKYIRIKANGKTVKAKVRDSCPPCGKNDIDVSPAVFKKLVPKSKGGLDKGVQKVTWEHV